MRLLKQSTAYTLLVFMTDSSDHVSGKTGLTLTITASKAGAAFASISPTVTDLGSGWYSLALTTTHTNTLDDFALHITGTGADPTDCVMQIRAQTTDDLPTAASAADAVWDEATSGHTTAGSTGKALTDASSAGDPWSTALPGAYGAGTAGQIIGDNLNAKVGDVQAKTDNLPSDPADESLVIAATDAIMSRLGAPAGASVSADVAAVKTDTAAIKTKTNSLTFTNAGEVDANVKSINDRALTGDGSATPWGPA